MPLRTVVIPEYQEVHEGLIADILGHKDDPTYEVYIIKKASTHRYNYWIVCPDFPSVSKDPKFIRNSTIKAFLGSKYPRSRFASFDTPWQYARELKEKNDAPQVGFSDAEFFPGSSSLQAN
jgi:hypothetical protein